MRLAARSADEYTTLIGDAVAPFYVDQIRPDSEQTLEAVTLTDQVGVAELTAPSIRLVRDARQIKRRTTQRLMFAVNCGGPGRLTQVDVATDIDRGEAFFVDLDRPFALEFAEGFHLITMAADRRALNHRSGISFEAALPVAKNAPSLRVVLTLAREFLEVGDSFGTDDNAQMAAVALDLMASLAKSASASAATALSGRQALLRTLQADVMARLGDSHLSPADLATRHHLSVRYVHALFTESGTSCAAYIRRQRLNAAEQLLGNRAHADVPIIAIAYRLGFNDPTSFIRAFRRQFGGSPSEYRASRVLSSTSTPA